LNRKHGIVLVEVLDHLTALDGIQPNKHEEGGKEISVWTKVWGCNPVFFQRWVIAW
jgi:hypothetical protein